jgi:3-deoxy-manno-octulosonate cytidylyltransferase (CMP-KDO synthetase)
MKTIAMIPARLDSERLPEKLMMDLGGLPIILRTYQNVVNSRLFDEVHVITDSQVIFNLITDNGGDAFISTVNHESGSDRIAEFASKINSDIILNIQGDEPFIDKFSLKKLIDIFKNDHDKKIDLASLMQPFGKIKDVESSSNVKVVVDNDNFALYFSRSIIPFNRLTNDKPNYFKHIGVYAFKKEALMYFYNSKPSNLEKYEKLEQLRFLENGKKIKMVETIYKGIGIDTMEDLINARKII